MATSGDPDPIPPAGHGTPRTKRRNAQFRKKGRTDSHKKRKESREQKRAEQEEEKQGDQTPPPPPPPVA